MVQPTAPSAHVESVVRFCEPAPEDAKMLERFFGWKISRRARDLRSLPVS